jgi:hypothetical protein
MKLVAPSLFYLTSNYLANIWEMGTSISSSLFHLQHDFIILQQGDGSELNVIKIKARYYEIPQ